MNIVKKCQHLTGLLLKLLRELKKEMPLKSVKYMSG